MHPTTYFHLGKGSFYVPARGIGKTSPNRFLAQCCSPCDPSVQTPDLENEWNQEGRKKLAYKQRVKQFFHLVVQPKAGTEVCGDCRKVTVFS